METVYNNMFYLANNKHLIPITTSLCVSGAKGRNFTAKVTTTYIVNMGKCFNFYLYISNIWEEYGLHNNMTNNSVDKFEDRRTQYPQLGKNVVCIII